MIREYKTPTLRIDVLEEDIETGAVIGSNYVPGEDESPLLPVPMSTPEEYESSLYESFTLY